MYICDHLKKKLCFYDDFKYNKKIIENRNFLRAKNVYLGVPGLKEFPRKPANTFQDIGGNCLFYREIHFRSRSNQLPACPCPHFLFFIIHVWILIYPQSIFMTTSSYKETVSTFLILLRNNLVHDSKLQINSNVYYSLKGQ